MTHRPYSPRSTSPMIPTIPENVDLLPYLERGEITLNYWPIGTGSHAVVDNDPSSPYYGMLIQFPEKRPLYRVVKDGESPIPPNFEK